MDPAKFTAFNVLEDEALRAGMFCLPKANVETGVLYGSIWDDG